jgi:hypothetical protein
MAVERRWRSDQVEHHRRRRASVWSTVAMLAVILFALIVFWLTLGV